jgi:hypothetical protein
MHQVALPVAAELSAVIEKVYLQNHAKLTQNWNSKSFKNPLNPFQNPFS